MINAKTIDRNWLNRSSVVCFFSFSGRKKSSNEKQSLAQSGECSRQSTVSERLQFRLRGAYRARQLYKNISMLFLFPVKDGKLSTGVNATFNASRYG